MNSDLSPQPPPKGELFTTTLLHEGGPAGWGQLRPDAPSRGPDAHWAAGARPSAPFCTAKEDGAVPIREHRAGEAGGDGAQRSGHADGATTGHSTNTDARAARRSGRGDSQDALPVASAQRPSIRRRRFSRRNLRRCRRGDVARCDDGPRDRSRASGSYTGLERKPWPS